MEIECSAVSDVIDASCVNNDRAIETSDITTQPSGTMELTLHAP